MVGMANVVKGLYDERGNEVIDKRSDQKEIDLSSSSFIGIKVFLMF